MCWANDESLWCVPVDNEVGSYHTLALVSENGLAEKPNKLWTLKEYCFSYNWLSFVPLGLLWKIITIDIPCGKEQLWSLLSNLHGMWHYLKDFNVFVLNKLDYRSQSRKAWRGMMPNYPLHKKVLVNLTPEPFIPCKCPVFISMTRRQIMDDNIVSFWDLPIYT